MTTRENHLAPPARSRAASLTGLSRPSYAMAILLLALAWAVALLCYLSIVYIAGRPAQR